MQPGNFSFSHPYSPVQQVQQGRPSMDSVRSMGEASVASWSSASYPPLSSSNGGAPHMHPALAQNGMSPAMGSMQRAPMPMMGAPQQIATPPKPGTWLWGCRLPWGFLGPCVLADDSGCSPGPSVCFRSWAASARAAHLQGSCSGSGVPAGTCSGACAFGVPPGRVVPSSVTQAGCASCHGELRCEHSPPQRVHKGV